MNDYIRAFVVFVVLLPIIFLSILIYQNDMKMVKKVISFDFKDLSRIGLWMSFFISLLLSTILAYSML